MKPGNHSLLFWWVGFPELFSVPSSFIQVSSFLILADLYFCF